MPLEASFDNLDDLNPDWPLGTDPLAEGDDHIRGVKKAVTANILGSDTETRLLSNALVALLATAVGVSVTPNAPGPVSVALTDDSSAGVADLTSDGAGLLSLVNQFLTGVLELRGSDAAPSDTKMATFDPSGAHSVNAVDEVVQVFLSLLSQAGVPYLRFAGGPATNEINIDALVNGEVLRLRGTNLAGTLQNLALMDPDTGSLFYVDGTGALGVVDGSTIGANIGAIQLNQVTTWTTGVGSPEGVVTASPGSIYSETVSGTSKPLWMKNFSAGNTGWLAIEFQP